jgi:hypothetical protein
LRVATTEFFVGSSRRRRNTFANPRDRRAPQNFAADTAASTKNLNRNNADFRQNEQNVQNPNLGILKSKRPRITRMMDWGAYASRVLVVASSRRRTLFNQKFAKAEHLRQHPPPSPTSLRISIELRRVERLRRAKETGALPRISLQAPAQILIHLPSHSRERLNIYATALWIIRAALRNSRSGPPQIGTLYRSL